MNEIVMPKLSDTMTEGRIVSWKKRVGETVRRGDVIAEVETDKANMELEAFTSGVLLEIRIQAGEMAQVGTVIAVIGKPEEKGAKAQPAAEAPKGEAAAAEAKPEAAAEPKPEPAAEPKPEAAAAEPRPEQAAEPEAESGEAPSAAPVGAPAVGAKEPPLEQAMEQGGFQAVAAGEAPQASAAAPPAEGAAKPAAQGGAGMGGGPGQPPSEPRERAAPVVRRRARELGVDLSQVRGSGPEGRILLHDLEGQERAPSGAGQAAATPGKAPEAKAPIPVSRLRVAIAKAVSESWSTIPHFSVTMDILMDDAEALRSQLKQSGFAVTVNDMVVKGVSLTLQKFPNLNASFAAGGIRQHEEINIGIAVGVTDGVLIPVISGCQRLSLLAISQTGRGLVERARSGSLSEQEMSGGTFSVSNLGMYGVSQFSAVIYPTHGAILAVGAVADTAVVRAGTPVSAKIMKVTLSADHRLTDGAYAAQFLVELKGILENPVRLLV